MIVVGGHWSTSTKRLVEICRRILDDTHHVQGVEELNPSWFSGKERIGVVGGASTPGWVIEEIADGMCQMVS
jgi:4-hydroxy-3-methylbut-2-enyl diphosphate reductase